MTSRAAPVSERLRTIQGISSPPRKIVPAFKTLRLVAIRCSAIENDYAWSISRSFAVKSIGIATLRANGLRTSLIS